MSVFLYALDNTVVADIVPAIVNDFGRVAELPWLPVGFALGGIALAMPFGKLFGLCDVKWLYIVCVVLFMAASALCGAAPNMDSEIVGRVLAGAGGNGMYLGVLTLLSVKGGLFHGLFTGNTMSDFSENTLPENEINHRSSLAATWVGRAVLLNQDKADARNLILSTVSRNGESEDEATAET